MCGIAGWSIATGDPIRRFLLAEALFDEIEPRGRDAAGIAHRDAATGQTWYQKEPIPGGVFAREVMDVSVQHAAAAVLHTRWATQGSPKDERNNHPIILPSLVGVHNGVIRNDREVFKVVEADRIGQVDSEAIFALLAEAANENDYPAVLELLRGSMAIAWMPCGKRELWLARGASSPLYAGRTPHGSLVFASTEKAVVRATYAAGAKVAKVLPVAEGTILRVVGGRVTNRWDFAPDSAGAKSPASYGSGYGWSSNKPKAAPKASASTSSGNRRQRKQRRSWFHDTDGAATETTTGPAGTVVRRWNDSTRFDSPPNGNWPPRCSHPGCEQPGMPTVRVYRGTDGRRIERECHDHWRDRVKAEQRATAEIQKAERDKRRGKKPEGDRQAARDAAAEAAS